MLDLFNLDICLKYKKRIKSLKKNQKNLEKQKINLNKEKKKQKQKNKNFNLIKRIYKTYKMIMMIYLNNQKKNKKLNKMLIHKNKLL